MKRFWTAAAFLMIVSPLGANAADLNLGASHASQLEASLVITANGRELFHSWNNPTGQAFEIEPVKLAERGRFLSAVVLFKGCKPNAAGDCNVVLDIVAHDPLGNIYGEMKGVELWQHKPAPDPGYTQLGVNYMGLVIEPTDPPGIYTVTAVGRDLNARREAKSVASFEVK